MGFIEDKSGEKVSVALSSVIASAFLTVGKLVVGVLTGSLGILSEAAHSALDFAAAFITYFAVKVSDKPADDKHHYGYAKVENLSALIEAVLLFLTCGWIIREAVSRLLFAEVHIEVNFWSYAVIVISIIIDFSRSRALSKAAQKYNSQALEADALHFSSDILSSAVVLAGLVLARFGIIYADPVAALIVAVIVIRASWKLAKKTVEVLLDRAPHGLDRVIANQIMETPGIVGVHKVRLRQSGGRIHGDLHVVMDRNISFVDGHKIATTVEEKLSQHSGDIVVHFEPEDNWEEVQSEMEKTRKTVKKVMDRNMTDIMNYHDLKVIRVPGGISVNVHVVLPQGVSVLQASQRCDMLEKLIKKELRNTDILFHIEPCAGACHECEGRCDGKI
ncbi:MAG: cation transporter [Firmicutes bacterium HGW-Firmicutes-14]|nr:MAG: cation transporter [Firmicutes bacterium HGW-Firmicutes-14]